MLRVLISATRVCLLDEAVFARALLCRDVGRLRVRRLRERRVRSRVRAPLVGERALVVRNRSRPAGADETTLLGDTGRADSHAAANHSIISQSHILSARRRSACFIVSLPQFLRLSRLVDHILAIAARIRVIAEIAGASVARGWLELLPDGCAVL